MIVLDRFCDESNMREYCRRPFNMDGRTIATDGTGIISIPQVDGFDDVFGVKPDSIRKILSELDGVEFVKLDISTLPKIKMEKCADCNGKGKAKVRICEECNGDGEVDAETDYNTYYGLECKSCDGEGKFIESCDDEDCPTCNGAGKVPCKGEYHEIDGIYLNPKVFSRIKDFKDLYVKGLYGDRLLFKSGDIEGILMGLRI